jgi:lambda repressor-like predicted transcriptional regulator
MLIRGKPYFGSVLSCLEKHNKICLNSLTKDLPDNATKIKIRLLEKGITGAEIARRVGVTRVAIYLTISGEVKSQRLRKAIADALGVPVSELWPNNNRKAA